jgi:hypothetical protein
VDRHLSGDRSRQRRRRGGAPAVGQPVAGTEPQGHRLGVRQRCAARGTDGVDGGIGRRRRRDQATLDTETSEVTRLDRRQRLAGACREGQGEGVARALLEGGGEPATLGLRQVGMGQHLAQAQAAAGEGAGLVEHHVGDPCQRLQRVTAGHRRARAAPAGWSMR